MLESLEGVPLQHALHVQVIIVLDLPEKKLEAQQVVDQFLSLKVEPLDVFSSFKNLPRAGFEQLEVYLV